MADSKHRAGDNGGDFTISRSEPESTLKVKWWGVILMALGVYAYFFTAIYNLNTRVTVVEVDSKYTKENIIELKSIAKDNNTIARESNTLIKQHVEKDRR